LFIRDEGEECSSPHPFLIEIKHNDIPPPDGNYRAYTFFKRFGSRAENDCLLFAEGMSIHKFPYLNEECQFREKITRKDFGYSDEQNIEIAKEIEILRRLKRSENCSEISISQISEHSENICEMRNFREYYGGDDNNVNPSVGECYVIMLCDDIPDGYIPYHVSYVLFKDGNTNITIEANAGGRNKKPLFDIYQGIECPISAQSPETDDVKICTFHETYKDIFVIKKAGRKIQPITTILEPVNPR